MTASVRTVDAPPQARFRLFGLPHVLMPQGDIPLAATRPVHLLANLVATGAWQRREDVGRLFWPDRSTKLLYSNLRNLLHKAHVAAPFATIEATEHAIRAMAPTDLADFDLAISRQDWESAVSIGASEFLQGFDSDASNAYLEWLQGMREARLEQWKHAVRCLLAESSRPLEYREALAQSWAQRSPYDEDAVHALIAMAQERHDPARAKKLYAAFEARLMDELGVKPSNALQQLLRSATTPEALRPDKPPPSGPANPGGLHRANLFGRRLELRQLTTLLQDAGTRLITITGPGGVGKSSLLAGFHQHWLETESVKAYLIDVRSASSGAEALSQVVAALGLSQSHAANNTDTLADALSDGQWLLLIDGAECPGIDVWLADLLLRCPNTRWVLAARQRLHLDEERLLVLDGFPMPDADETDPEVLEANDGVRFLVDMMARVGAAAEVSRETATIAEIVRAVEGHPLALKLLGSLTHLFSLPQLLQSLQPQPESQQALAEIPAFSDLFPGLITSFETSWRSLSATEQLALARLAVFPADFSVAAALSVAKTQLPIITALVDRSLLRAAGSGRLSLHSAIRSSVLAIWAEPAPEATRDYLTYYVQCLRKLASLATTKTVRPLLQFIQREHAHIDKSWALAVQQRDYATLLSLQESVWFLDDGAGDSVAFSARCVEVERATRGDPALPAAVRAMLLAATANYAVIQKHFTDALNVGRSALREAHRARHFPAKIVSLTAMFHANLFFGNMNAAEQLRSRIVALLGPAEDGVFTYWDLDFRALQSGCSADMETAFKYLERVVNVAQRIEFRTIEIHFLVNLAFVCHRTGRADQAIGYEDRAFATHAGEARDGAAEAKWLSELAHWHVFWGNVARARVFVGRAETIAGRSPQNQIWRLKIMLARAAVLIAEQNLSAAKPCLTAILEVLSREDVPTVAATTLLVTAKWFRLSGDIRACRDLLEQVLATKRVNYYDQVMPKLMLDDLGDTACDDGKIIDVPSNMSSVAAAAIRRMHIVASRPFRA